MMGQGVQTDSAPQLTKTSSYADGTLLLGDDLRIIAFSPEIPALLQRGASQLWGQPLQPLLPELASRLQPACASAARGGALLGLIETQPALSGATDGGAPEPLYVLPTRVTLGSLAEAGWLLSLSLGRGGQPTEPLSEQEEAARRLALLLRVEAEELIVAGLSHDLNNTFQTLTGSIWLMQEQMSGLLAAHLSRLEAACRAGIALLQVQSSLFQRTNRRHGALSEIVRASEPALRRLLRGGQKLALELPAVSEELLVERRPLLNLLLQLGSFVGTQAALASSVVVSLRSALPAAEAASSGHSGEPALLLLTAKLPAQTSSELWDGALRLPEPLWACGKLAEILGARFTVQVAGSLLRAFVWFRAEAYQRREVTRAEQTTTSNP